MQAVVYPARAEGNVSLPSSKSEGHRALICACLAKEESNLYGITLSQDINATVSAMRALGAVIEISDSAITVKSGIKKQEGEVAVDCSESGSTLRFVIPICLCMGQSARFTGRGRLLERPQTVYEQIAKENGILFKHTNSEIVVSGRLRSGDYTVRGDISSQFISGLMMALPIAGGKSSITILPPFESKPYVRITKKVQEYFGAEVLFEGESKINIGGEYSGRDFTVEKDMSAMAFFAVLAAINGKISFDGVKRETEQGDRVITDILESFGASVQFTKTGLIVEKGSLSPKSIDISDCPDLGPIAAVLLAYSGGGWLTGTYRLRIKESDRAEAIAQELTKLGAEVTIEQNAINVGAIKEIGGRAEIEPHNDHRIAMSMAIAAACGKNGAVINNAECVNKSYPDFFKDLRAVGIKVDLYE